MSRSRRFVTATKRSRRSACELASAILTSTRAQAIFAVMRWIDPIWMLTRALSLAVVGFVLVTSTASAHEGRAQNRIHLHAAVIQTTQLAQDGHAVTNTPVLAGYAVQVDCDEGGAGIPCSEDGPAAHMSGSCCNIACHAALAAPAIKDGGANELGGSRLAAFTDMLVGQLGARTERPPKRG